MLRFWKKRVSAGPLPVLQPLLADSHAAPGKDVVAERRRTSDTNGTLRRMRQTVENNRLL